MSKAPKLEIVARQKGSKGVMNQLRKDGFLPGSISRKGEDAISFSIKKDDFRKALNQYGMSSVYTLQVGKKTAYPAMVREIQYAPMTREWLHVTFQLVSLTEETTAEIPLQVNGRDEVHHKGFETLQQLETLHVRGLPGDFPSVIEIDISGLEPGQHVTVADLKLPKGIHSETEGDRLIVSVSYPKITSEESAPEEAAPADAAVQEEATGTEAET